MQEMLVNKNHAIVVIILASLLVIVNCTSPEVSEQKKTLATVSVESTSKNVDAQVSPRPVDPTMTPSSVRQSGALFEYTKAVYLSRATEYKDAIAAYSHVLRIMPEFALAYHGRGVAYHGEEQLKKALDDFNSAIKFDPVLARAYKSRALVYLEMGDNDNSITDLNMAISLYHVRRDALKIQDARRVLKELTQ